MVNEETESVGMDALADECMALELHGKMIKERELELKELKARHRKVERSLAAIFVKSGMSKATFGGSTFYVRRDFFVSKAAGISQEQACSALREAEMDDYISETYSSSQVKAHIKELADELTPGSEAVEALPEPLQGLFNVYEVPSVRVRST